MKKIDEQTNRYLNQNAQHNSPFILVFETEEGKRGFIYGNKSIDIPEVLLWS